MRRWLFAMLLLGACGEKKTLDPLDPESFQQFSGTVTVETGGRTDVYDYTRDGSKIRIVPRVAADSKVDQRFAIIVDQEAKTTTAISWGRKQFFVQPLSAKSAPTVGMPLGQPGERPQIMTRKFLEPASLDGHACNVETALMRSPGGAEQHVKVWSAKDLQGFPVRIESHIGSNPLTVTFSGVKLGPAHDPTLFKVPEGFKNAAAGG